jgi:hypothetical protein
MLKERTQKMVKPNDVNDFQTVPDTIKNIRYHSSSWRGRELAHNERPSKRMRVNGERVEIY